MFMQHTFDDNEIVITSQIYNNIAFSLYSSFHSILYFEMGRSTQLEIPDREKGGIERKGNFINYFIVYCACSSFEEPAENRIPYHKGFSLVKSGGLKYVNFNIFKKRIKVYFICIRI